MEIRKITEKERPAVLRLHQYAYGFWSDQETPEAELDWMFTNEILGLFDQGQLKSTLILLRLEQAIRGVLKGLGGISMVGTYPEARYLGYAKALLKAAFDEMLESGLSVSMLEPFRESYYGRMGYVSANSRMRLEAPLHSLRHPSKSYMEKEWTFERIAAVEGKTQYLDFITDFAPKHYNGFAFRPNITDVEWKRRNKNALMIFIKRQNKIEALAKYRIKGYMHEEEAGQLEILEMYWRSVKAQAALFSFFGTHKDQLPTVQMRLPYGTDYQHWFADLPKEIVVKTWNPWMVRVIDFKKAVKDLPAQNSGSFIIKIKDDQCSWNNGTYLINSSSGVLKAAQTTNSTKNKATIEGFSALVYGIHSLETLEYAGWLEVAEKKSRKLLQQWFPLRSLYNPLNY